MILSVLLIGRINMKRIVCEDCDENKAEYECPACGIKVCEFCMMAMEGSCMGCAPRFVDIKKAKKKK